MSVATGPKSAWSTTAIGTAYLVRMIS
jgi:hypothetical protein